jgi:hypothetical protein
MDDQSKPQMVEANKEELESEYASNTFFVPTVWDLKILFGELSSTNQQEVDWHTSMTLPWAQAKLMAYYLDINIAAHEFSNGPIRVHESLLPPVPPPIRDVDKNNPTLQPLIDFIIERRKRFLESLK